MTGRVEGTVDLVTGAARGKGPSRGGAVNSGAQETPASTGLVLERWWDSVDGFSAEDPKTILAEDLSWRITYGKRSRGGGKAELLAYATERALPGRRHGIALAQVAGDVEVVAGHLLVDGAPVASFAATAERDDQGRMRRFLAGTSEEIMLAFAAPKMPGEPVDQVTERLQYLNDKVIPMVKHTQHPAAGA